VLGREGGMIKRIYFPFLVGLGGPLGNGNQYMPWIHITDLVSMFIFALINNNVHGILNGVAPQVIQTFHEGEKFYINLQLKYN